MTGALGEVALDARVVVERGGFGLDAEIAAGPGDVVAVMGPSGAGKSTLLGALAGLVRMDAGYVSVGGRMLDAPPATRTAPASRGVVMLGQEARLFPHLTARDNVVFGLRAHGVSRAAADATAEDWLDRVGLAGFGRRRPAQLSGGQQQRVALARALATSPAVLLLDEPFTSLDAETAGDVRALVHDQLGATGTTAVVATHDAVDAVALASQLLVLEGGAVTQHGPVRDVLAAPATRFAAAVAGLNRVPGDARSGVWRAGGLALACDAGDGPVAAVFRPSDVGLLLAEASGRPAPAAATDPAPEAEPGAEWIAEVVRLEQTPAGVRIRTREPDVAVDVAADRVAALSIARGSRVRLRVAASVVRFLPGSART